MNSSAGRYRFCRAMRGGSRLACALSWLSNLPLLSQLCSQLRNLRFRLPCRVALDSPLAASLRANRAHRCKHLGGRRALMEGLPAAVGPGIPEDWLPFRPTEVRARAISPHALAFGDASLPQERISPRPGRPARAAASGGRAGPPEALRRQLKCSC